jgi:predicted dehydrogenase
MMGSMEGMGIVTVAMAGTRGHYAATLREIEGVPGMRVVGVTGAGDPVGPLVEWCKEKGHEGRVYESYEGMLEGARPDVVVVCGAFEDHARMCVEAIRRRVHVVTEKPAALTLAELGELKKACAERPGVHLAGMMFSRYSAGFLKARDLIRAGEIGEVRMVDARKSYKLGVRPAYYHQRAKYGGTIPWVGSHAIDWVMHLTGLRFESVYAAHSRRENGGNGTMERSAVCQFRMEREVLASVSIDVFRPAGAPSHGDDWARVVGTRGVVEVRPGSVMLVTEKEGPREVELGRDGSLVGEFVGMIQGKGRGLIDTAETLQLTEACLLARLSADEDRVVKFD